MHAGSRASIDNHRQRGNVMLKTWVLVADRSRARFFSIDTPKGPLKEFEDRVCPEARMHGNERLVDGGKQMHRHGNEHHTFPPPAPSKDQEVVEFAREVATRADAGRMQGDFERLVLVAAPDFLGTLRKKLPAPTAKLVDRTIDKNLTQLSAADIRRHLPEIL
jgi:protein required for attachment to host cells